MLSIDTKINFRNFGFIPQGGVIKRLYGKLFGHPNYFKRLQAKDIIESLDLKESDTVLDFGCGSGYFTVEIAKCVQLAIGIDINPRTPEIPIADSLKNRLKYVLASGENLPFEDNAFDKILLSEVIATVENPKLFLKEIKRVLKPNGIMVICNGTGPKTIEELFKQKSDEFKQLQAKFPDKMPNTFEQYSDELNRKFGNSYLLFYQLEDLQRIMSESDFSELNYKYSPGKKAGHQIALDQLTGHVSGKSKNLWLDFALNYRKLEKLSERDSEKYLGGLIYTVRNDK